MATITGYRVRIALTSGSQLRRLLPNTNPWSGAEASATPVPRVVNPNERGDSDEWRKVETPAKTRRMVQLELECSTMMLSKPETSKEFPAARKISFPASRKISFPVARKISFPAARKISFPATRKISFPATRNIIFPATRKISFPAARKISFPAARKISFPASRNRMLKLKRNSMLEKLERSERKQKS